MLTQEDREIISQIGKYKYNQIKDKGLSYEEYLQYLKLKEDEKHLRKILGNYRFKKMKELGLSYEEYLNYEEKQKKEKELKQIMGYAEYKKMKELGLTPEQYKKYKKEQRKDKKNKYKEKNKIRYRTIRYIERYCNLKMECQICNTKEDIQIHHPNYKDYLKINLLCRKHHNALHKFELIPPQIIDLEDIAIKSPINEERKKEFDKNLKHIKEDVLLHNYTYRKLSTKYGFSSSYIKKYLSKDKDWSVLNNKLKNSAKEAIRKVHRNNEKNILQNYRIENNLSIEELSKLTQVPIPTLRAIECGKTRLSNIRLKTKTKLQKVGVI